MMTMINTQTYTVLAVGVVLGLLIGWLMDILPTIRKKKDTARASESPLSSNEHLEQRIQEAVKVSQNEPNPDDVYWLYKDNAPTQNLTYSSISALVQNLGFAENKEAVNAFKSGRAIKIGPTVYTLIRQPPQQPLA